MLDILPTSALHEKIGLKLAGAISYLKSEDETTDPEFDSNSLATAYKFNNFHDATVAIALPVSVTKNLTITQRVTYALPLSGDAKYKMKVRGLRARL